MDVRFLSPHGPGVLEAEVDPATTSGQALVDLVGAGFLRAPSATRTYSLVLGRTGQALLPGSKLQDAGVRDGDVVEVVQATEGASPCRA